MSESIFFAINVSSFLLNIELSFIHSIVMIYLLSVLSPHRKGLLPNKIFSTPYYGGFLVIKDKDKFTIQVYVWLFN